MKTEAISEIRIDDAGRLCVFPSAMEFSHIYRSAMEVHWDSEGRFLYSPPPREWTYVQWFQQIIAAVEAEYGCALTVVPSTLWSNVEPSLKAAVLSAVPASRA